MPLRLRCHCKVNLLLNILERRPDDFHELETVLLPVPVHDELEFEHAPAGTPLQFTCDNPDLPVDDANLVVRAANAFFTATGLSGRARIRLAKRIPMAAGLGGGSSNAAFTLRGLNQLFDRPLANDSLYTLGASLGSDVAFFLQDRPALATGRGEQIEPLPPFQALAGAGLVLVRPGFGISTPWAYQELKHFPSCLNGERGRARKLAEALQIPSLHQATAGCYNSLEAPVFNKYPWLLVLQEFMRSHGAIATLMSGSGSTTFAIAESPAAATGIADRVRTEFGDGNWIQTVAL